MADMTIDDATEDTSVTGVEKLPASDGGSPKSVTTGQIRDFILAELAESDTADSTDLSEDGIYITQDGETKRLTGTTLAQAFLDYACSLIGIVGPNGNEIFVIDDSGTKKTITLAQVTSYITANAAGFFDSLAGAGTMAASDKVMVKQGGTVKEGTLGNLAAFALSTFAAFIGECYNVLNVQQTDKVVVVSGGTTKWMTVAQFQAAASGGIVPPSATTAGNIPTWGDSAGGSLGAGLSVGTSVRAQGTADNTTIPTEAAVRAAIGDGNVTGPNSTTENKIPQWDSTAKKLKDGLTLATTVATPGVDTKVPTEKAVRTAIAGAVNGLGAGDVTGPTTTTENKLPQWDSTQKKLKNGLGVVTSVGGTGANTNIPTEKAVRDAISDAVSTAVGAEATARDAAIEEAVEDEASARDAAIAAAVSGLGAGDVKGPLTTTSGKIPQWDSTKKKLTDGLGLVSTVGGTGLDTNVPTEKAVRTAITGATADAIAKSGTPTSGKLAKFNGSSTVTNGPGVTTSVGTTGSNDDVPTEMAVRKAITAAVTDALATAAADATTKANAAAATVAMKVSAPIIRTEDMIPTWGSGVELKAGLSVVPSTTGIASSSNASDSKIPTEAAVRAALPVAATTSAAGLMSAADKAKLDGMMDFSSLAEVNAALGDFDTVLVKKGDTTWGKSLLSRFWTYISGKLASFKIDALAAPTDPNSTACDASTTAHGLCPKLSGNTAQFLRGDGQFATPTGMTPFGGTDGETAGRQGLVPAPATTDENKFLSADGTWKSIEAAAAEDVAPEVLAITRYDTIFVPAAAMCPSASNGATPGAVAFTNTKRDTVSFGTVYDESCEFDLVLPDDWNKGYMKAKFLWTVNDSSASASTNVKWSIGCISTADGGAVSTAPTNFTDVTDALSQVNNMQRTDATSAFAPDGSTGDGNLLHFVVKRNNTNPPSSPMGKAALLLGVWIQYARSGATEAWS